MPHYFSVSAYQPFLAPEEVYATREQAAARDKELIADELSGLAPEVIERMLTEGLSDRQQYLLDLLIEFGRTARLLREDADDVPAMLAAAE